MLDQAISRMPQEICKERETSDCQASCTNIHGETAPWPGSLTILQYQGLMVTKGDSGQAEQRVRELIFVLGGRQKVVEIHLVTATESWKLKWEKRPLHC